MRFVSPLVLVLRGRAEDPEDGTAPCGQLKWDVRRGHNAHSHPWRTFNGCQTLLSVSSIPGHGDGTGFFLAIELSYTDAGGPGGEPPLTGRQSIRVDIQ